MAQVPNWNLFRECQKCGTLVYGQYDVYCPHCGTKLKTGDIWLANISDYAKTLLIDYLEYHADLAMLTDISEIPANATENIRNNGNVAFSQTITRFVLAENWNEVDIALADYKDETGTDYVMDNIEHLHVFAVAQHAEIVWRKITNDFSVRYLDEELIAEAVVRLKAN
jgi:hypothetical protein